MKSLDTRVHLSYKDVLLVPYDDDACYIKSRLNPDITGEICPNIKLSVPLVAAPMDSITTAEMAIAMKKEGAIGIITRFINDPDEVPKQVKIIKQVREKVILVACAMGVNNKPYERAATLCDAGASIICIDIANGNHIFMKEAITQVQKLKDRYAIHIIAGNVATSKAALRLADWGADTIKVGIGCFLKGSLVRGKKNSVPIEKININDHVLSHTGREQRVIRTYSRKETGKICSINGIKCTKNHRFYVLHKKFEPFVTDDNIHEYAKWIEAENLTKEYLLIKIKKNDFSLPPPCEGRGLLDSQGEEHEGR